MALVVSALKAAMAAATAGKTDAASANTALGNAIASYIVNNCVVTLNWVGQNPSSPYEMDPDNGPQDGFIVSCTITLTPSGLTDQEEALADLAGQIKTGVAGAVYSMPVGWTCNTSAFSDIGDLTIDIDADTSDEAFTALAQNIVDWLTGYVPSAVCSGTHGIYVGTGTPTGVS